MGSNRWRVKHNRSTHTIFSSASITARSSFRLRKNCFSFCLTGLGGGGRVWFSKSNPESLSIAVLVSWSITILLCFKKGKPNITGAQREEAMTAWTIFEVQEPILSYKDSLTHSCNSTTFLSPD